MRYKENKSLARLKIYFSSNFKRAFKSYSNKTSKSRPASRYIVWFTSVERTIWYYLRGDRGIREKNNAEGSEPPMWGRRGYKKCSGITSNFHWSWQNGYRTCKKISYGDRFRQVLYVRMCMRICICACMHMCVMHMCVCADSQYVQPQRATADGAFPTIFCAFCASMERLSRCALFPIFLLCRSTFFLARL